MSQLIKSEGLALESKTSWLPSAPASGRSAVLFGLCFTFADANVWQSHLRAKSDSLPQPAAFSSHLTNRYSIFSSDPPPASCLLLLSCSRLIVNQGENNIGVLRHSVPPHSCGPLSAQIQSCRRPLAQPSATMSGRLGKAQHSTLG